MLKKRRYKSWPERKNFKHHFYILPKPSCFIFSPTFWFLSCSTVIVLTRYMYDHKTCFSWLETPVKIYLWTWTREPSVTYKVLVFRFQIHFSIGHLLTCSRISKLVKPSVGPENVPQSCKVSGGVNFTCS